MKLGIGLLVLLSCATLAHAITDDIYVDGFDPPHFTQRFPLVAGKAQLPPGSPTSHVQWFVDEMATGETTTAAEVAQHLTGFDANNIANWLNTSLRPYYPNARIVDVVAFTAYGGTLVIQGDIAANPKGFLVFQSQYTGSRLITYLTLSNLGDSVMYNEDKTLSLDQAADKALTLAAGVGVLVAKIQPNGQCSAITQRNAGTLLATASIFKNWVLSGMGRMIADGALSSAQSVTLTADRLASGGQLNSEPLGTSIPIPDLATFMMANSDNTATDLMHQRVGRTRLNAAVDASGVANPDVLKPLLDISEQFQLIYSFPLATSQSYVNGTEAYQNQFLAQQIEPRGNVLGSYTNFGLLVSGTWHASPLDVCAVYAANRRLPQGSEAFQTVDGAMGAQVAQPYVRNRWDRAWYKGGSLSSASGKFNVLTHAWLLENAGASPYFVATMYNDDNVNVIDQYKVQSIAGRILQILADTHP